ncbi:Zn-ribbon domain-containing OB-fold protein [Paraburkholderia sp. HP33-1]|uniref:Zn-ribbon domain-containing OB-fold protein n=1 Tax=Paraburkholderia sp. HP33-1 TaxID=2883243 RepID=UPI001F47471C|nr:OB-fold domain-containing protein [Paraburkholderia sp. HP33-1]
MMPNPTFTELAPYRGYTEAIGRGVLAYQHCEACERAVFPPRVNCPHCGATQLHWRDSAGIGTVYSATEVVARDGAYNVVLVDLDEGFRMMSTVPGVASPAIGQRVHAHVEAQQGEASRVVFEVLP